MSILNYSHTASDDNSAWRERLDSLERLLAGGLQFGVPVDINAGVEGGQKIGNMRGSWVEVTLTSATGTVTCSHNLNIPTTSITGAGDTANRLNVRWFVVGVEYGDRTGTNAAPAAPGGFSVNLLKMSDATITANAVDLRYAVNGFTPSATRPLYLSLFFIPAVR